jgi:hypothetical protein
MAKQLAPHRVSGHDATVLARVYLIWRSCLGRAHNIVQDDMKILVRTLSSPTLLEDLTQLDAILATEGWQTLMTFTRESARTLLNF